MAKAASTRVRRRERKNITSGVAHVNATFNNTLITITDAQGNAISWSSAGGMGFKGKQEIDALRSSGRGGECGPEGARTRHEDLRGQREGSRLGT